MDELAVLVCDDSLMARKQLIRAFPEGWPISLRQASNGLECLKTLRAEPADLLFLDLTMPEMDGYQVLEALHRLNIDVPTIVVSGDVQDAALDRVMALGALDFLHKPVDPEELCASLRRHGFYLKPQASVLTPRLDGGPVSLRDAFRELTNVAMGRAGALLGRVLGVFVELPVPNVNMLEAGELHMALADARNGQQVTAICQGYIGEGIAGEALLLFHDSDLNDITGLLGREVSSDEERLEVLLDLASILIGACLKGLFEQWSGQLAIGHPVLLGQGEAIEELIRDSGRWKRTLAVEISYSLEGLRTHFDLLLLFTEDSLPRLAEKISYLMGDEA